MEKKFNLQGIPERYRNGDNELDFAWQCAWQIANKHGHGWTRLDEVGLELVVKDGKVRGATADLMADWEAANDATCTGLGIRPILDGSTQSGRTRWQCHIDWTIVEIWRPYGEDGSHCVIRFTVSHIMDSEGDNLPTLDKIEVFGEYRDDHVRSAMVALDAIGLSGGADNETHWTLTPVIGEAIRFNRVDWTA